MESGAGQSGAGESGASLELRVVSAGATAQEIAAATAVLEAALEEFAAVDALSASATRSGWALSQAGLRSPIRPGEGRWRSFVP